MSLKYLEECPEDGVKFVAFSCPHAPLHDKAALTVIAARIAEYAPDVVVCLGDLHEADSASRWPSENDWTIEDEFHSANEEVLKPLRLANPNPRAEQVFLPGNHDDNILALDRIPSKVRGRCDWTTRQYTKKDVWLNEELMTKWTTVSSYRYNRREGTWRIGSVVFAHGYEAGVSSDEFQSIILGWPYGLFISGHTHRPTQGPPKRVMRTKGVPMDRWYLNAGCTTDMDRTYMHRKRQMMWGHGVVYGWSRPIASPRFSKTWDAYCELIKPYEE